MAVLELLAGAAPTWLVAAELLVLVQAPGLDVHGLRDLVDSGDACRDGASGGRGQRARLVLGAAARVAEVPGRAGARGRRPLLAVAVLALDLDLDPEDVAAELLPDGVD